MKIRTGSFVGIILGIALQLRQAHCSTSQIAKEMVKTRSYSSMQAPATLSDGEQIALEVTNQLLPPPELSSRINEELRLIKLKYRAVSKINHSPRWIPGQIITTKISEEQIRQLNTSMEFGPLIEVSTVDLKPFYIVTVLTLNKPYNPIVLGEMLKFKLGFSSSPNTIYHDGDDIFFDSSTKTYIFKQRTGESVGCGDILTLGRQDDCGDKENGKRHYWEFVVSNEGNPRLVKEYDIDGDGNKKYNLKYAAIANTKFMYEK